MPVDRTPSLTIGRLAKAAGVGIETVRYYEQRGLLPQPARGDGVRRYPDAYVGRIRFVKRAQALGFTLDEISALLKLEDGAQRQSIRAVARQRLAQIEAKLADLQRMQATLRRVLAECEEKGMSVRCPIIATMADGTDD